jgi:catechol 2,3-dioxygenase-like lactoylglutathione lyase family enzyme
MRAVHHVQLACPPGSEAQLRGFYTGVLGMSEVTKPPALAGRGGCWFRSGGVELHLGVEEDFRPARKAHPGIVVDDLQAYDEGLSASGAPIERSGREQVPGFLRLHTADPVGNRLELLTPLSDLAATLPPERRADAMLEDRMTVQGGRET